MHPVTAGAAAASHWKLKGLIKARLPQPATVYLAHHHRPDQIFSDPDLTWLVVSQWLASAASRPANPSIHSPLTNFPSQSLIS